MHQPVRPAPLRAPTSTGFVDHAYPMLRHMRAELATALRRAIAARGWSDAEAAAVLHIGQPRVGMLKAGRWDRFTLDLLLTLAIRLDLAPRILLAEPKLVQLPRSQHA